MTCFLCYNSRQLCGERGFWPYTSCDFPHKYKCDHPHTEALLLRASSRGRCNTHQIWQMSFTYLSGKWGPMKYLGKEGPFQKRTDSLTSRLRDDGTSLASDTRFSPPSDLQQLDASFSHERQHLTLVTALLGATISLVLNFTTSKAIWEKGKACGVIPSTTKSHPVAVAAV